MRRELQWRKASEERERIGKAKQCMEQNETLVNKGGE